MLPREKLQKRGVSVLSDLELVEVLVGSGVRGRDFKQISRAIMNSIQRKVKDNKYLDLSDLVKIDGVGDVVAMRVLCGIELGKRIYGIFDKESTRITNSQEAYEILKDMSSLKRERVDILCLNSRFECIARESIAMGSLNCANLSPREVVYSAIINNSAFVILAHNHPSGDSTPSKEDVDLTQSINKGLDMVGVQLLDHIVIGRNDWKSVNI